MENVTVPLELFKAAHAEFCSMKCQSTGPADAEFWHDPRCMVMKAIIKRRAMGNRPANLYSPENIARRRAKGWQEV